MLEVEAGTCAGVSASLQALGGRVTGGKWGAPYSTIHLREPRGENRVEAARSRQEAASKAALRLQGWEPGDSQAPSLPLRCCSGVRPRLSARPGPLCPVPVSLQRGPRCGRLRGSEGGGDYGGRDARTRSPSERGRGLGGAVFFNAPPFGESLPSP